jgi:hypothetical protein
VVGLRRLEEEEEEAAAGGGLPEDRRDVLLLGWSSAESRPLPRSRLLLSSLSLAGSSVSDLAACSSWWRRSVAEDLGERGMKTTDLAVRGVSGGSSLCDGDGEGMVGVGGV